MIIKKPHIVGSHHDAKSNMKDTHFIITCL